MADTEKRTTVTGGCANEYPPEKAIRGIGQRRGENDGAGRDETSLGTGALSASKVQRSGGGDRSRFSPDGSTSTPSRCGDGRREAQFLNFRRIFSSATLSG